MNESPEWFFPRGTLGRDGWESVVDASLPGWAHTGLRIGEPSDGAPLDLEAGDVERIIVPLAGSFTVSHTHAGITQQQALEGRRSVFDGPTDVLYLPIGTAATISGAGRVAVTEAPANEERPVQYVPRSGIAVELRGAGRSSRQVHNFGTPGSIDAVSLIACEVITPAENWSSYPPHKHDEHVDGQESSLEEIYYFESAVMRGETEVTRGANAPAAADAFGMFAAYSSPAGALDINALVHTGDVALVPHGYHGPAVAAPGYDLYYLNVMAGPDPERVWRITDDPAHAWVRESWADQPFDARLPYLDTTIDAASAPAPGAGDDPTEGR